MHFYNFIPAYPDDSLSLTGVEVNQLADRYRVNEGFKIDADYFNSFHFDVYQHGVECDVLANNLSWIIVSKKLGDVLRASCFEDNFELIYFPIKELTGLEVVNDYFLLNVLKKIPCLNFAESEFSEQENDVGERYIEDITRPVLELKNVPEGVCIFRLVEYEFFIIVCKSAVVACRENNIVGCQFIEIEATK